jgi:hypothetical protein
MTQQLTFRTHLAAGLPSACDFRTTFGKMSEPILRRRSFGLFKTLFEDVLLRATMGMGSKYINQGERRMAPNKSSVAAMVVLLAVLGACAQTAGTTSTRPDKDNQLSSTNKIGPGMNANGEVIDATKVESGYGQKVKGINDFEGEVTGITVPNGKFSQLQIGMGIKQVMDIAGPPTDQGAYITGKARQPMSRMPPITNSRSKDV